MNATFSLATTPAVGDTAAVRFRPLYTGMARSRGELYTTRRLARPVPLPPARATILGQATSSPPAWRSMSTILRHDFISGLPVAVTSSWRSTARATCGAFCSDDWVT